MSELIDVGLSMETDTDGQAHEATCIARKYNARQSLKSCCTVLAHELALMVTVVIFKLQSNSVCMYDHMRYIRLSLYLNGSFSIT